MRIGVAGPTGLDMFAENIADALRGMGHQVIPLGPVHPRYRSKVVNHATALMTAASPRLDEGIQRRLVRAALAAECEIVLNVDYRLGPDAVSRLQRNGIRVAFWFPDHVAQLGRQLMILAPYDALFFKEPHVVDRVRANLGLPAFYLPEACHARLHRPCVPAATDPHLVTAGNMYPARVRVLERLLAAGIPLRLYGAPVPPWVGQTAVRDAHARRAVFGEDKARVFRSAAAVLNTMHPGEVAGVNVRLFEAAGSGAAVLTEYRPCLAEVFDIGTEVLAFRNFGELVEQATRLLTEQGLSARLGDAAARRAHRDHTYERRLAVVLEKIS